MLTGYYIATISLKMMPNQFGDQVSRGWGTVMGPSGVSSRNKGHEQSSSEAGVDRFVTMGQTVDQPEEGGRSVVLSHRLLIRTWSLSTGSVII